MKVLWITLSITIFVLQRGSHAEDVKKLLKLNSEVYCPKGWHAFDGFCYKGFLEKKNFEDAEKECVTQGGHLAAITSQKLQEFVTAKVLLVMGQRAYIGLRHNESTDTSHWTNGSVLEFLAWDAGEPSRKAPGDEAEHCVEMTYNDVLKRLGKWNDISCNQNLPYICQKIKDAPDEPEKDTDHCSLTIDGIYFRSSCFHLSLHRKTWEDAEKYCVEQYSGHLAAITDAAVQKFLHYAVEHHPAEHSSVWIGIQLKPGEVDMWSSGWYLGFNNWKSRKENGKVSTTSCAAMSSTSGEWTLGSCHGLLSFICENSTVIPPPKLQPTNPGLKCPSPGWMDLGGDYCYFIDKKAHVPWHEASFLCMRKGGALASIHSKNEEEVLAQFFRLIPRGVHIGLYRPERVQAGREFEWVDHSPVVYENWRYGEPNDVNEMCVEAMPFQDMKWNDNKCGSSAMFVCSIAKKGFPNSSTQNTSSDLQNECQNECLPTAAIAGVVLCVLLVIILLSVVLYNFISLRKKAQQEENKKRKNSGTSGKHLYRTRELVVSEQIYENIDVET